MPPGMPLTLVASTAMNLAGPNQYDPARLRAGPWSARSPCPRSSRRRTPRSRRRCSRRSSAVINGRLPSDPLQRPPARAASGTRARTTRRRSPPTRPASGAAISTTRERQAWPPCGRNRRSRRRSPRWSGPKSSPRPSPARATRCSYATASSSIAKAIPASGVLKAPATPAAPPAISTPGSPARGTAGALGSSPRRRPAPSALRGRPRRRRTARRSTAPAWRKRCGPTAARQSSRPPDCGWRHHLRDARAARCRRQRAGQRGDRHEQQRRQDQRSVRLLARPAAAKLRWAKSAARANSVASTPISTAEVSIASRRRHSSNSTISLGIRSSEIAGRSAKRVSLPGPSREWARSSRSRAARSVCPS